MICRFQPLIFQGVFPTCFPSSSILSFLFGFPTVEPKANPESQEKKTTTIISKHASRKTYLTLLLSSTQNKVLFGNIHMNPYAPFKKSKNILQCSMVVGKGSNLYPASSLRKTDLLDITGLDFTNQQLCEKMLPLLGITYYYIIVSKSSIYIKYSTRGDPFLPPNLHQLMVLERPPAPQQTTVHATKNWVPCPPWIRCTHRTIHGSDPMNSGMRHGNLTSCLVDGFNPFEFLKQR